MRDPTFGDMSGLKWLIHEMRRRSLWQVLTLRREVRHLTPLPEEDAMHWGDLYIVQEFRSCVQSGTME